MPLRLLSCALIAVMVNAVALAPWSGAALPIDNRLENMHVQGPVSPDGSFVGTLTIIAFTVGDAGQLLLTGVLNGTVTHRTGAKTRVTHQTFTAPATLPTSGQTPDTLRLDCEPIFLDPLGLQITLAQITLDLDAIPSEGHVLAHLLNHP